VESPSLSNAEVQTGSRGLFEQGLGRERLALGTAGLGGIWAGSQTHQSVDALLWSLEQGLSVWDTAPAYGSAEVSIGNALKQWRGPLPVISTKVGRTHDAQPPSRSYQPEVLRATLSKSLDRMGVDSVDILFLHEPEKLELSSRGAVLDELLRLKADGLARHLGLGGGWGKAWDGLLSSQEFSAAIVFLTLDACCLDSMIHDVPRLKAAGVAIYGGSPLHMGLLATLSAEKAPWAKPEALLGMEKLKALSAELGISSVELAHRFVYSLRVLDRVLIGPRDLNELKASMRDFQEGVLPRAIFHQIYDDALARAVPRE